jgi:hypothetical protein
MDKFLPLDDDLAMIINTAATDLYHRLLKIDVNELGMPGHCLAYFTSSHSKRLFFSTETSAHILYKSVRLTGKTPSDVVIMDYGAGVGTLFLLAKMIGCKKVVYSDHLEDWKLSAGLIAKAIGVSIDHYIVGDIDDCLNTLEKLNIQCDIITSRNVVEHIYKLDVFYSSIYQKQPRAIIFSSTTANKANPAASLKHKMWHRKWEKIYRGKRLVAIERQSPGMAPFRKAKLAKATRGLAADDLANAIDNYRKTGTLPKRVSLGTNTCDPSNGVWAENLLSMTTYRRLINENRYTVSFEPGFWDTHYKQNYVNKAARLLNRIISRGSRIGMMLAPFIYIIARPKKAE